MKIEKKLKPPPGSYLWKTGVLVKSLDPLEMATGPSPVQHFLEVAF